MARATNSDPFRCFRFAPKVGFDGKYLGVSRIEIDPGVPWGGPGRVEIQASLYPDSEFIEFAKIDHEFPLVVGVFHVTDDFGVSGTPSIYIVLNGVTPAKGGLCMTPLESTSQEVLEVKLKLSYDRLSFVFGNDPLAKIAAVT